MHVRRVVYDGWRFLQYHCCQHRFLSRNQGALHLLQHPEMPRRREARYTLIAALTDQGAIPGCEACRRLYAPRKVHARATSRVAAIDAFPERGRVTLHLFLTEEAPDPLLGYQRLAAAVLRRARLDATQGKDPALVTAVHRWLTLPQSTLEVFAALLDLEPDTLRHMLQASLPP